MPELFQYRPVTWPGEEALRGTLLDYVNKYSDANKNLQQLTPYEEQALSYLDKYLTGTTAPTLTASESEILKTLSGGYNPETSSYYQPLVSGIERKKNEAITRSRRSSQLGGNLTSLSRLKAENDLVSGYDAETANLLMGLQERERARQLQVLPQALQYGQYVEETPLRKAEAARTVGSIPRDLQTGAINLGSGILTGYRPTYFQEPTDEYFSKLSNRSNGVNWGGLIGGGLAGYAGLL